MTCSDPFIRDPSGRVFKLRIRGSISVDELHRGIPFPCGQCLNCRINKRREWTARLMLESLMHENTAFVTLTYDEKHLPEDGSLQKRDIQLFFKRLRQYLLPLKIRYYLCGEYGERTHRPHYHAIIFGIPKMYCSSSFFERFWKEEGQEKNEIKNRLGMCHVGYDSSLSAMQYVCGYVTKKIVKGSGWESQPEFSLMSRKPAIGSLALTKIADCIKDKPGTSLNTVKFGKRSFSIGRTLSDKLYKLVDRDPCEDRDNFYRLMEARFFREVINGDSQSLLDLLVDEGKAARLKAQRLHKLFDHRDAI